MGIQPGARFPARSADALSATLHGHFTQAIYRNRPIAGPWAVEAAAAAEARRLVVGWGDALASARRAIDHGEVAGPAGICRHNWA